MQPSAGGNLFSWTVTVGNSTFTPAHWSQRPFLWLNFLYVLVKGEYISCQTQTLSARIKTSKSEAPKSYRTRVFSNEGFIFELISQPCTLGLTWLWAVIVLFIWGWLVCGGAQPSWGPPFKNSRVFSRGVPAKPARFQAVQLRSQLCFFFHL